MQLLEGENWPLIPQLRLGDAVISATLDTGSSGLITLYHGALDMPGVRSALVQKGEIKSGGFQGEEKLNGYVFNKPIGFGHFELPPGIAVTLRNERILIQFGECRQQAFCVHELENNAGLSPPHDDLLWRLPLTIVS